MMGNTDPDGLEDLGATDLGAGTCGADSQVIWTPEMEADIDLRLDRSLPPLGSDPLERARARLHLLTAISMYLGRQLGTLLEELPLAEVHGASASQLEAWLAAETLPNPHALAMEVQALLGGKLCSLIADFGHLATSSPRTADSSQRKAHELWHAFDRFAAEQVA
jgi:hypothetical protein